MSHDSESGAGTAHVTEWALGECVFGTSDEQSIDRAGFRWATVACDGSNSVPRVDCVGFDEGVREVILTCPRCAVLRDAALEGRLPQRDVDNGGKGLLKVAP